MSLPDNDYARAWQFVADASERARRPRFLYQGFITWRDQVLFALLARNSQRDIVGASR
jgi:hypothetical protein